MKVSVALAAYKGERYIVEQLNSILSQLAEQDEIIVSDDCPGSVMSKIVLDMAEKEPRIHYIEGPSEGVIRNFENAIRHTTGDVIFLCDQDDVWLDGKVAEVTRALADGADLVLHDASVTDENLNVTQPSFFKVHHSKAGYAQNVLHNSYMGCCMAFKSSLKQYILPIPKDVPMHDQYIGLIAEKYGKVALINKPLILYRIHGDNVTGHGSSLQEKIKWRVSILKHTINKR